MSAAVHRLWPESTVVCIGGGPSLTPEDVNACRDRARVILINDAYRIAPWGDVLYAADSKWWREHQGVPSFTGPKYSLQPESAIWPDVQVLENTGFDGLELQPTGLRNGLNSGYQAINLAVHLGARRIVLLGYDMRAVCEARSHWFGAHPKKIRGSSPYADFVQKFSYLVEPLAALGIQIVNCSRQSALDCFPRQPLEDTLQAWSADTVTA
jgi:hypothetical protein